VNAAPWQMDAPGDDEARPGMTARRVSGGARPAAVGLVWLGAPVPLGVAAPADEYVRDVEVVRVIDGDTFVCNVDLGFYSWTRQSCRLAGINCNEHNEPGGREAAVELGTLLALGPVTVRSVAADKFAGRFDAVVSVTGAGGTVDVNRALVAAGFAVPWNGRGAKPKVPWPRGSG
jgi:endonuclease YncB( thermonuclease family)